MLIQTTMIIQSVELAQKNPSLLPQVANSVARGAKEIGLDVSTMTLTPEGFRRRKNSDASEVIGADPDVVPTALAASAPAVSAAAVADADDNTATYALIAAAGGAGLAAIFMLGRVTGRHA